MWLDANAARKEKLCAGQKGKWELNESKERGLAG
jgi:hypothetical protein